VSGGKIIKWDYDFISGESTDETPVCLSDQERQILLSVLEYVGWSTRWYSDIGTAINQDVIDLWKDNLAYKLMGECMVDCADVWACLGITGDIPESLSDWLIDQVTNNGDVIESVSNPSITVPSPVSTDVMFEGCDLDSVFGFVLQLVQWCNTAVTNGYEKLELITNQIEFAMVAAQEIPYVTEVASFVDYMQEQITEAYLAAYDETYENEVACALFCIAIDPENTTCSLTWEQCYEYFLDRFGAGLANKNIIDLLNFIGGGGWAGTEFCDASIALFCGIMHFGGEWFGLTLQGIQKFWSSWFNDPNSDWETLCECGWTHTFDFSVDQQGFVAVVGGEGDPRAKYIPASYWTNGTDSSAYYDECRITRTTVPTIDAITKIRFTYDALTDGSIKGQFGSAAFGTIGVLNAGSMATTTVNFAVAKYVDNGVLRFDLDNASLVNGNIKLRSVKLWGTGEDPFV